MINAKEENTQAAFENSEKMQRFFEETMRVHINDAIQSFEENKMIYIENPVDFFERIDTLASNLFHLVSDANKEEQHEFNTLFFTTSVNSEDPEEQDTKRLPIGLPLTLVYSGNGDPECDEYGDKAFKKDENENERDYFYPFDDDNGDNEGEIDFTKYLFDFDLLKYSFDNKTYYSFYNDLKGTAVENRIDNEGFCYICDITETFYTKITKYSKIPLRMYRTNLIVKKRKLKPLELFADDKSVKYVLKKDMNLYFKLTKDDEFLFDVHKTDGLMLLNIDFEETNYNVTHFECHQLSKKDIWSQFDFDCELIYRDLEDYYTLYKPFFEQLKSNYQRLCNSPVSELHVFDDRFVIDKSEEQINQMGIVATVLSSMCGSFGYFHKIPINGKLYTIIRECDASERNCYDILVNNTAEKGATADAIIDNAIEVFQNYKYWRSGIRDCIREASRPNPIMNRIYAIWKMLGLPEADDDKEIIPKLPGIKYINDFIQMMQDFAERFAAAKEKVDNFSGGFVGGGFGVKGALKGTLAAGIANAATELAYEAYQAHKIDAGTKSKILNEFMKTERSKNYFHELIFMDVKCLFFKEWERIGRLFMEEMEGIGPNYFNELFEKYHKSVLIYSIAVAKALQLAYVPIYDGMDEYYKMDPLTLIQKAILEFPYDYAYYEKYVEYGGEMTEDINNFAIAHMVDIRDISERELRRIQKEKEEREEQERIKAEKQRQEEEKSKEIEKMLKEKYGEIAADYPDLFMQLANNSVFLEYGNRTFENHREVNDVIFLYLDKHFSDIITNFHSVTSPKFNSKQRNLVLSHRDNAINASTVLFFYDNTLFGSAKEGFVVTKDKIYVKNFLSNSESIAIKDIKSIVKKESYVYINGTIKVEFTTGKFTCDDMVNILTFCVCNLLLLSNKATPTMVSSNVKGDQWTCSCGSINAMTNKFCPQCGSPKPVESTDWVCPSCQNKNPSTSKFCGNCGTQKPV